MRRRKTLPYSFSNEFRKRLKEYQALHKENKDYSYPLAVNLIQAISRAPELGVVAGPGLRILDYEGVSIKYEYEMQYLGFGRIRFVDLRTMPDRWSRN